MQSIARDTLESLKNVALPTARDLRNWLQHRNADAFLLSFPKCGRTWFRLMLGKAFQLHFSLDVATKEKKLMKLDRLYKLNPAIPRILSEHDDWPQWKKPDELNTSKRRFRRAKVILLVRDPRDVVVSSYFEHSRRFDQGDAERIRKHRELRHISDRIRPYGGSISEFIREDTGSFRTILRYYNIWFENRAVPRDLQLIRYEDLSANPAEQLQKTLAMLGCSDISADAIGGAVDYASFDNMRKMESQGTLNSDKLRPGDAADEESYKTRKGKVHGFSDYLAAQDIDWMNRTMRAELPAWFGYNQSL